MSSTSNLQWLTDCTLLSVRVTMRKGDEVRIQAGGRKFWSYYPGCLAWWAAVARGAGTKRARSIADRLDAIMLEAEAKLQAAEFVALRTQREQLLVQRMLERRVEKLHAAVAKAAQCGIDEAEVLKVVGDVRAIWRNEIIRGVVES